MDHFYVSIFIFLLMSSCAFLVLTTTVAWWKKLYVVIALVLAGMLSYRVLNVAYGHPSILQNDYGDVLVIGYYPDTDNETIYMWIKEHDDRDPTSYKMPYSIKLHKQLERSRRQHRGTPYRSMIKSKNSPLERFTDTVDDVIVKPLPTIPLKKER